MGKLKVLALGFILLMGDILLSANQIFAKNKNTKPNIILILADDLGYGDISFLNPKSKIKTPNIDKLASEGISFTNAHSNAAVCTPSRYGILTGRYAWRTRLKQGVLLPWESPLIDENRETLPAMLKKKGYYTACVGKWHLGWQWNTSDSSVLTIQDDERRKLNYIKMMKISREIGNKIDWDNPVLKGPTDLGFDYYFGDDVPNYPPYTFIENKNVISKPTFKKSFAMFGDPGLMAPDWKLEEVMPVITNKAIEIINDKGSDKEPFFLFLSLTAPHVPVVPLDKYKGKSDAGFYGDFVYQMDDQIGQVLEAVKKSGIEDNTLIIFTSDNGAAHEMKRKMWGAKPEVLKYGHNSSHIFKGIKSDIWEGGQRLPLVMKWSKRIQAGETSNEIICFTDFMSTIADITHSKIPFNAAEDSFSFKKELFNPDKEKVSRQNVVLSGEKYIFAIMEGKWKYIEGNETSEYQPPKGKKKKLVETALYDMDNDLEESKNLINQYPEVVKRLSALLQELKSSERTR